MNTNITSVKDNKSDKLQRSERKRLVQSKLESLNNHLESLVQKKIRIDLEIQSCRRKLRRLTSDSRSLRLEVSYESYTNNVDFKNNQDISLEQLLEDFEINEFLAEIERSEAILEDIVHLPLYEERY